MQILHELENIGNVWDDDNCKSGITVEDECSPCKMHVEGNPAPLSRLCPPGRHAREVPLAIRSNSRLIVLPQSS